MAKSRKSNSPVRILAAVTGIAAVIILIAAATTPVGGPVDIASTNSASLSLISPVGGSAEVGQRQTIKWSAFNYAPRTVTINILRKVSDNPATYELVRTVADATLNDGVAIWVPSVGEVGDNIYVEVGCVLSDQACTAAESSSPLAVIDNGRFSNTAATYQAIEAAENN